MDRTREARRVTLAAATNGLPRRRHRSSSIRDSPEDDAPMELLETARLRDRGAVKKDRDRERDRERERERDRERERERERERDRDRLSRTSKRRRDRLMSSREEGGDDSSEESVNDDEDDDDDGGDGSSVRILPSSASLSSSSLLNHHQQQQHHHRKSYPPPAKVFRPATPASPWKATDEMIGVSVPRKARSASTKRSHECWATSAANVIGGEQILRQASTSPVQAGAAGILSSPSPAPPSPSSSNASMRKKMKQNGQKQRPPKSTSKSVSSAQEDIEIEIAEVLYGMMRQPQGQGPKQEIVGNDSVKFDSREANKFSGDAKSRVSSPISNSPSMVPPSSSVLPPNSNSAAAPISAIAPKRKRPRPVEDESPLVYPVRNGTIPFAAKVETERSPKAEVASSPHLEKNSGFAIENGLNNGDLSKSEAAAPTQQQDQMNAQAKVTTVADLKPSTGESENHLDVSRKEGSQLPGKASPDSHVNPTSQPSEEERDNSAATKGKLSVETESQREEKFQIDLMAPPPTRSSPERDGGIDFVAVDPKAMAAAAETEVKPNVLEDNKAVKIIVKEDAILVADNQKPAKTTGEEAETQNPVSKKERAIDLQLDLEKADKESGTSTVNPNKINHNQQHQPQQSTSEKTAMGPSPWPMPTWPGGIAPVGYMAPLLRDPVKLQGVVSVDSSTMQPSAIQSPHLLFNQPKPKRCATHCYIARNIHCNQQFIKINPFWAAQAGSASLYGAKACGLNVVPPTELHASMPGGGATTVQDKGQTLAIFPSHAGKDKGSSAPNMVDAAQRKQILVQQPLPPGAPSNILHGPTFIFPLSQQQAATAVSVQPGSVKSPPVSGSTASSSISNTASVSATPSGAAAGPTMSFSYPNMPGSETQYLAILQNNGYPFPIPAHVGAPAYRGSHAQAMPFFNGSFYSSQILHPSQLQQQQQPPVHSNQSQQGHQNPSMSTGSSSSQKQQQNQQSRPHGSGANGNVQVFPPPKMQSSQQVQLQQRPQLSSAHVAHQQRQLEGEIGGEDSPSTADSRVSRNINIYGQNFAIPMHSPNFAFMTPASTGGSASSGSNPAEKKQQIGKSGGEPLTSQAFAMSFASISGANTPGLDISSFASNHAILQSLPEATRQGYQIMAAVAAQAAQQKKNYPILEDSKRVANDGSNLEEERKGMTVKNSAAVGQSIAFSRPDLSSSAGPTLPGNVIDSSSRALNLGSSSVRTSGNVMSGSVTAGNAPTSQQLQRTQQKLQQQQQQQILQLQQKQQQQQQQQLAAAVSARSKTPVTSNGSAYPAHITSSAMTAKFPNGLAFPPNLVQSTSSPAQSPQWNTLRTSTSQVTSPPSASSTMKNISQQGRSQQSHTQISFAANPKASTQGQQPASSTQSPSPPMVASSPTTSISKSAGGSPRMTGSSVTGNKAGQASSLSSQQVKSSSVAGQKSSPVGGRNVQSILGNPHITSSASTGTKPPAGLQQHQQQQMQQKHALQQVQLFSNAYAQAQAHAQHSSNAAQAANAYYMQRHRNEQQQQPSPGSTTSSSMLSLCSTVSLANTSTSDPAKMVVAASNMKGGVLTSQGIIHHGQFASSQASGKLHQLVPPGYPYVHPVPTAPAAVQVKQGEQKQPAGD